MGRAVDTAARIRRGEVSAREVVEESIRRIEQHDPQLNALVTTRFDEALADVDRGLPDGPLTGVPILVKDLAADVAGLPSTRGSRPFTVAPVQHGRTITGWQLAEALQAAQQAGSAAGAAVRRPDVLLVPTLAQPVPCLGLLDTSRPESAPRCGLRRAARRSPVRGGPGGGGPSGAARG